MAKKLKAEVGFGTKKKEVGKAKPEGETKEQKLIKLLSGKDFKTVKEIMKATGYAEASANMYVNQSYLDRKNKPYRVIQGACKCGNEKGYRYEAGKK